MNALLKWLELAPNDWDTELIEQLDEFNTEIAANPSSELLSKKLGNSIADLVRFPFFLYF